MGHRQLCLTAWTIAVGVITGALSGSDCQCTGSTRPAQLFGNTNKTHIDFHFLPSNTSDTTCQWIISSKTIARLQFRAVTFRLRSDNGSCVDNFTVYDGNSSHSPILLSTCSRPSFAINSSGREVLLSFTAGNNATSDIGFFIEYESFWSTDRCNSVVLFSVSRDPQYLEYPANDSSTSNSTDRNASCGWLLQASSPDYIVNIDITTYLLDTSLFYIDVFDGPGEVNLLDTLWVSTQAQFLSSGQYLYISLVNSNYIDVERLNLTYQEVNRSTVFPCNACSCSGALTASHLNKNYLRYPADQTQYSNDGICDWELTSASDYVIHVTFLYINVETNTICSNDYVEVIDGSWSPSNSLGALCEGRYEFYSSGQTLYVQLHSDSDNIEQFHSDSSITGHSFLLSYEAVRPSDVMQDIGGRCLRRIVTKTATSTPQSLVYPSNSSAYADNVDCNWLLQATGSDEVLHVIFTFVDIQGSGYSCPGDYVQVFDGSSSSSDSLGKLCGSRSRDFYSSGRSMYIKFHSDAGIKRRGFRLTYQAVYRWNVPTTTGEVCLDGVTKRARNTSQSLNYPLSANNYDNNVDCDWLLQAPSEYYVVYVNFTFVDIEGSDSSCLGDYVQVFDGSSSSAVSLSKLCGSTSRDFYSSGRSVYIKFHSDGSVTRGGFRLTYQAVYRWSVPTTPQHCNSVVLFSVSPDPQYLKYPADASSISNSTARNASCGWLLQASSPDYIVIIDITTYLLHTNFFYIDVFDGPGEVNLLDTLWGSIQVQYLSSGQYLYISLVNTDFIDVERLNLTYQEVNRSTVFPCNECFCRSALTASHLHKNYLRYPADQTQYPDNVNCHWKLTSASDYVIHVTFQYIYLETNLSCSDDYVEVFDGSRLPSNSLGAVCNGRHEFYSSGQTLYVQLHSDSNNIGQGFLLSYEAVRPSDVMQYIGGSRFRRILTKAATSTPQSLVYPSNSSTYAAYADCNWLLQAPLSDYVVHVNFTFVDIEGSSSSCLSDYVQVFDGSSSSSDTFGKLCGSRSHDFYSSGRSMYIKFHSDAGIKRRGFRLTYQAVYRWNVSTTPSTVK